VRSIFPACALRWSPEHSDTRITQATYIYDANEQLAIRDSIAAPVGVTHYVHDIFGNVIAETAGGGATGATGTVREYPWDKP
jgi:hypothetical protein